MPLHHLFPISPPLYSSTTDHLLLTISSLCPCHQPRPTALHHPHGFGASLPVVSTAHRQTTISYDHLSKPGDLFPLSPLIPTSPPHLNPNSTSVHRVVTSSRCFMGAGGEELGHTNLYVNHVVQISVDLL